MSHFTRVQTQIRNMGVLQQALEDLNYQVQTEAQVSGHQGRVDAGLSIKLENGPEVGFIQNNQGEVEMVADWWGSRVNRQEFLNEVTQRYAYKTVMAQAEAQGFNVTTQENLEDGSVRLVMQRWAKEY